MEHIFASTCAGHCVVWDLRKQSSIMTISDTVSRVSINVSFIYVFIILFVIFSASYSYIPCGIFLKSDWWLTFKAYYFLNIYSLRTWIIKKRFNGPLSLQLHKPYVNYQMKTSNVIWNPHVATQLLLSSDNDLTPWAQMWDLRYATSPIKTLEGHQRGVLKTAWCIQDPNLLITAAKDSK